MSGDTAIPIPIQIGSVESAPKWRNHQGKWVEVRAQQGTYAARRAPVLLREAERVAEAVERLLKPAKHAAPKAEIYLLDPVGAAIDQADPEVQGYIAPSFAHVMDANPSSSIVHTVRPEAPGDAIAYSLVRLLLSRWANAGGSTSFFASGIASLVNARLGLGQSIQQSDDWVRSELEASRPVSAIKAIQAVDADPGASDTPNNRYIAASFVNYLVDTFGASALKQFLSTYDPDRRDQAAIGAYQKPLAALEEGWLSAIRRASATTSVWRTFLRHLSVLLKPYWLREVEVLVYMVIGLSYGIALPLSGKFLIDTVIPGNDLGVLGLFVAGLLALYVLNALVGMRRGYVISWINQQMVKRLDEALFAHLQRLPHSFYSEIKLGDIISRFTTDMQMVQNAANQIISSGPYMLLTGILAGSTVLILNPMLGAVVLVIVPFFVISYLTLGPKLQKASAQRQKLVGEVVGSLQENLSAHAVIKAYGLEQKAIAAFKKSLETMEKAALRVVKIGVLFETSMSLAVTLGQLLVLGVGGYLVMQHQLTIGTLLAFIGLLPSLIQPITTISSIGQTVKTASGAINRVTELLNEPVTIPENPDAPDLPSLHNEIRFENVDFSYASGNAILDSLSLRIRAGANVAIVGPSGSGKSTIVSLLMRFYDPAQGRVTFDGTNIQDVKLASLRDQIGLVFQDTFIFDTTVRENIAHGKTGATDVEILAAAKAAQLHTFIEGLPSGYDTVLGERGVRMSGGQRQRLAIARALIRKPGILILDEATSALDSHTEREILDTLNTVAVGRTVISITHRLAIAAAADRIYVLDHGRLVEEGTHADLVKSGGLYSKLYQEQTNGASQAEGAGLELELVQAVPLFNGFSETLLASLARKMSRERFFEGEVVVAEGDPGDKLYIVQRGSLEVMVGNENTPGGERRVNALHPPDYFGEMALLTGEPRSASVRAIKPTEVLSLSRADFLNLLDHEESLRASVQSTVSMRSEALEFARGSASQAALS